MVSCAGLFVARGIDVKFRAVLEKLAERFHQAAGQVGVKFFVQNVAQAHEADGQTDGLLGMAREVGDEAMVAEKIGNQHGFAQRAERVHAVEKITMVNRVADLQLARVSFQTSSRAFRPEAPVP